MCNLLEIGQITQMLQKISFKSLTQETAVTTLPKLRTWLLIYVSHLQLIASRGSWGFFCKTEEYLKIKVSLSQYR